MSESKKKATESLNVVYVFSENNKVYIKNTVNGTIHKEEWHPINFQWRS